MHIKINMIHGEKHFSDYQHRSRKIVHSYVQHQRQKSKTRKQIPGIQLCFGYFLILNC